jgi:ABC-type lipoprotein export system ATPase subunit
MSENIKFKHPFTCIVSGPTCSGKTSFCIKLLQNLDSLCTGSIFKGGIIWCYSEVTAVPREKLNKLGRNIQYQEGLPENFGNVWGEMSLIILDELLIHIYSKDVCDLFTKGSHRNISVLVLTHNVFHQGPNCRHFTKRKIFGAFQERQRQESVPLVSTQSLSRRQS